MEMAKADLQKIKDECDIKIADITRSKDEAF